MNLCCFASMQDRHRGKLGSELGPVFSEVLQTDPNIQKLQYLLWNGNAAAQQPVMDAFEDLHGESVVFPQDWS